MNLKYHLKFFCFTLLATSALADTSLGRKLVGIPSDKKLLNLDRYSLPPSGMRHLHGHRALQDACDAEITELIICLDSIATGIQCDECVFAEYEKAVATPPVTCEGFEEDMCNALTNVCNTICGSCVVQYEEAFACLLVEDALGCNDFNCGGGNSTTPSSSPSPSPSPSPSLRRVF